MTKERLAAKVHAHRCALETPAATRLTRPDGTNMTTMKNRILRIAAERSIPVTIRRVPGGLIFWRSTDEDLTQAKEVAQRLQPARQPRRTTRPARRRRASRGTPPTR